MSREVSVAAVGSVMSDLESLFLGPKRKEKTLEDFNPNPNLPSTFDCAFALLNSFHSVLMVLCDVRFQFGLCQHFTDFTVRYIKQT